ncbi:MAG: hypothetical protein JNK87_12295 [Bryobacterales bacterium]|nr:hypothetical protein [Bryobacterales bacterium]
MEFATALEEARGGADAKQLREWLSYWNQLRRYAAAQELGDRRDAASVRALLGAVFSFGDVAAVEALGQIGDAQCLAPLLTLFEYSCGRPQQLVDTLGRTIAGFGGAGVTALLPFANTRRGSWALDAARAPTEPVRRASAADVEPLVYREDWQSRLLAVELLRCCVDPKAAAPLLARLREDPDVVVRYCARQAYLCQNKRL